MRQTSLDRYGRPVEPRASSGITIKRYSDHLLKPTPSSKSELCHWHNHRRALLSAAGLRASRPRNVHSERTDDEGRAVGDMEGCDRQDAFLGQGGASDRVDAPEMRGGLMM